MNDLDRALDDIGSIRRQVAQATEFRGYGPATLAGTGLLAIGAATAQAVWLPNPASHIAGYLSIWIWTAALSAFVVGTEMFARTRRIHSGMADEMIRMAVEGCRRNGIHSGLCGQAPSDYPDIAEFLVRLGIDSISLNPDVVVKTTRQILQLEQQFVPLQ